MKNAHLVTIIAGLLILSACATALADGLTWHVYGGHTYALTATPGTWLEVQGEAESHGGDLVTINDSDENAWLLSTFAQNSVPWIGFYQPPGTAEPDQGWEWVSGQPVTFVNWWGGQPNEHMEGDDYALMNSDATDGVWFNGQWQDVPLEGWPGPHLGIIEIPEPATLSLLALGGLALLRRKK